LVTTAQYTFLDQHLFLQPLKLATSERKKKNNVNEKSDSLQRQRSTT